MGPMLLRNRRRMWVGLCCGLGVLPLLTVQAQASGTAFMNSMGIVVETTGQQQGYNAKTIGATESAMTAYAAGGDGTQVKQGFSTGTFVLGAAAAEEGAGCALANVACPIIIGGAIIVYLSAKGFSTTNPTGTDPAPATATQKQNYINAGTSGGNTPTGMDYRFDVNSSKTSYCGMGDPCGCVESANEVLYQEGRVTAAGYAAYKYTPGSSATQATCIVTNSTNTSLGGTAVLGFTYASDNLDLCGTVGLYKVGGPSGACPQVGDANYSTEVSTPSPVFYPTTPNDNNPDPGKQLVTQLITDRPNVGTVTLNPQLEADSTNVAAAGAEKQVGYTGMPASTLSSTYVNGTTIKATPGTAVPITSLLDPFGPDPTKASTAPAQKICFSNCGAAPDVSCSNNTGATYVCTTVVSQTGTVDPTTDDPTDQPDTDHPVVNAPSADGSVLQDALSPLMGLFPGLATWSAPGHTGTCPSFHLHLDFFKDTTDFTDTTYCDLLETNRTLITGTCIAAMVLLSLLVLLGA